MTLYEAVESGDVARVQEALATARDVNELGPEKRTPLIEAAGRGDLAIVELLLAAGAEPSWRDATDETALLKAAANGHPAVTRLLSPLADEAERALALSFLAASGATHAPEDVPAEAGLKQKVAEAAARAAGFKGPGGALDGLKRKAAEVAARAAHFVGHDEGQERLDRVERSESNAKKK